MEDSFAPVAQFIMFSRVGFGRFWVLNAKVRSWKTLQKEMKKRPSMAIPGKAERAFSERKQTEKQTGGAV